VEQADLGVSLVVSIYNRTDTFRRTYPTWLGDKTWPNEILILDDGSDSDDGLGPAVGKMQWEYPDLPIYYTYREKKGKWTNPAVPHNWLVKQAKGPIVLIIDPEVAFVGDGIPMIREFYRDEANRSSSCTACLIYSVQRSDQLGDMSIEQIVNSPHKTTDAANPDCQPIIMRPKTPAKGYRAWWRQRYIDLGGKDERYIGWGYEDLDIHHRQARLPPVGINQCLGISIVEFWHPPPPMTNAGISCGIWVEEGSRAIPEDGVANRGEEWGVI
jgi:hypothetical protein